MFHMGNLPLVINIFSFLRDHHYLQKGRGQIFREFEKHQATSDWGNTNQLVSSGRKQYDIFINKKKHFIQYLSV